MVARSRTRLAQTVYPIDLSPPPPRIGGRVDGSPRAGGFLFPACLPIITTKQVGSTVSQLACPFQGAGG